MYNPLTRSLDDGAYDREPQNLRLPTKPARRPEPVHRCAVFALPSNPCRYVPCLYDRAQQKHDVSIDEAFPGPFQITVSSDRQARVAGLLHLLVAHASPHSQLELENKRIT